MEEDRIHSICSKIEQYWRLQPDLRFGQLVTDLNLFPSERYRWSQPDNITEQILDEKIRAF